MTQDDISKSIRFTYLREEHEALRLLRGVISRAAANGDAEAAEILKARGFPIACIATRLDKTTNTLYIGLSTVHPADRPGSFSKARARKIAVARLASVPYVVQLDADECDASSIQFAVVDTLYSAKRTPTRVRKVLKDWMPEFYDDYDRDNIASYPSIDEAVASLSPSFKQETMETPLPPLPTVPANWLDPVVPSAPVAQTEEVPSTQQAN